MHQSEKSNNRTSLKRFTQIGSRFLSQYRDKHDSSGCRISGDGWTIQLNMPITTLEKLNAWCNNFTHNPFIMSLPQIYFAYDQYERFTNKCIDKPDVTITGDKNMKAEFGCFVMKQDPKAQVKWPKDYHIEEPSVQMRIEALSKNLKNLWNALKQEFKPLLALYFYRFRNNDRQL